MATYRNFRWAHPRPNPVDRTLSPGFAEILQGFSVPLDLNGSQEHRSIKHSRGISAPCLELLCPLPCCRRSVCSPHPLSPSDLGSQPGKAAAPAAAAAACLLFKFKHHGFHLTLKISYPHTKELFPQTSTCLIKCLSLHVLSVTLISPQNLKYLFLLYP